MEGISFYNSITYKERQAEITRKNWQKGIYDFLRKQGKRQCANSKCGKWLEVTPADPKRFCSRKCAAQINNAKRSNINSQAKEEIVSLYRKGLSMQEIAEKMEWGVHKISYWLDKCNVLRRSPSEAAYAKWNPNGDPFKIKNKLNLKEILLKGLGLGLYWGEGDRSSNNTSVRIGNTDPYLLKKFKEFLVKICGVKKDKFKYSLILFNDCNEGEAIKFWEQHLKIKRNQLGKITKIPPRGKGTYKKKSQFGVFTIIVTNKKLKEQIFKMIEDTQIHA